MSIEKSAGIDFAKTFGQKAGGDKRDLPKAQFWLNVGYSVEVDTEEGVENRFVSLPVGIPLDTQEKLPTNSRNQQFAQFQSARNDLMDQILEVAQSLTPGEERILNLEIQLRRVNEETVVSSTNNPFAKKLSIV